MIVEFMLDSANVSSRLAMEIASYSLLSVLITTIASFRAQMKTMAAFE